MATPHGSIGLVRRWTVAVTLLQRGDMWGALPPEKPPLEEEKFAGVDQLPTQKGEAPGGILVFFGDSSRTAAKFGRNRIKIGSKVQG